MYYSGQHHIAIEVSLELNLLGEKGEKKKTGNCGA